MPVDDAHRGAALSRFLGRELECVALEEVVQLPGLRLDPAQEPEVTGFTMRGIRALPVLWDA